jgi:diguanylate cyclase
VQDLVALHLRQASTTDEPDAVWKRLVLQLLAIVAGITDDHDSPATIAFRDRLNAARAAFAQSVHPQEWRQSAAACAVACERLLRGLGRDRSAREQELAEVIAMLRAAITRLMGDSTDFELHVRSSTGRIRTIGLLDNLDELKAQLSVEVSSLERLVEVQKQRSDEVVARLAERVEVLQADLERAAEQASTDPLTRVANRGAFDRTIVVMTAAARASGAPLTLAMIDVDHFKQINDTHGHPIGDRVLLCTANWIKGALRQTDLVARYGGEEFAALLPGADLEQTQARLAALLHDIASRSFDYDANGETRSIRFTVSCGIAQLTAHETPQALVARADHALYDAKSQGRNRVVARRAGSRLSRLFHR